MTFLAQSELKTFRLWAALKPEYMTISSEDLTMKFGTVMDGFWTVVAIVDAGIDEDLRPFPVNDFFDIVSSAVATIRTFLGRPKGHWGITPIAVYTPIHGLAETEAVEQASEPPPS